MTACQLRVIQAPRKLVARVHGQSALQVIQQLNIFPHIRTMVLQKHKKDSNYL